jgi:hypothetical protein
MAITRENDHSVATAHIMERKPNHPWHEDEQRLMTILYRWYEDSDPSVIPYLFNAITGLSLKQKKVHNRFHSYIVSHGGQAIPEFGQVMAVPFHDPEGRYNRIHEIIEVTASRIGVELLRRTVEEEHRPGSAKRAKCRKTREHHNRLLRSAKERGKKKLYPLRVSTLDEPPLRIHSLGGLTLSMDPMRENEEGWSDTEDQSRAQASPAESPREASTCAYSIAFRAYDDSSFTAYSEEKGFVSSKYHHCWPRDKPLPPPLNPNGEMRPHFMADTNNHLSMTGGTSPYITVCTSLLQTMVKASNMENPRIAVGMQTSFNRYMFYTFTNTYRSGIRPSSIPRTVQSSACG